MKSNLTVIIRGAGELASAVACRLSKCHFNVCMLEIAQPRAVRRGVSFSEAIYDSEKVVEGVTAMMISSADDIARLWGEGKIPLMIDPEAKLRESMKPDVLVDAIIAKKNLGTRITDASLVIGLGVGFYAGKDVHTVIETNRGHNLGRVIVEGQAEPDTGVPGIIAGVSAKRVLRAPDNGVFVASGDIGDIVKEGDPVGQVNGSVIEAGIAGVIRGLLRTGTTVNKGMKAGDVDPRGVQSYCFTISDKARSIAGGVLEAILARYNV